MAHDGSRHSNETVSFGDWFVTLLLAAIPLVGFVLMIVWAFASGKPSKRTFARAWLLLCVLSAVAGFVALVANWDSIRLLLAGMGLAG